MIPTRFREIIKHITTFLILLSSVCNKTMLKNRQKPQKKVRHEGIPVVI